MRLLRVLKRAMDPDKIGPVKCLLNDARCTLKTLPNAKLWFCGGYRTAAVAARLIGTGKIVAIPTDTIYGLAGLAQDNDSIAKLYEIKGRDASKPLAICVCDHSDIEKWAHTEDLPEGLIEALLPGPTTLVLKRKETLNPSLNPGVTNVGIRIPASNWVRSLVKILNQPIALTSANKSNTMSTLHPSEFEDLWPKLDGIFYEKMNKDKFSKSWRKGSTVVDLSIKGEYKILRGGTSYRKTDRILGRFHLIRNTLAKDSKTEDSEKDSDNDLEQSEKVVASSSS